MLYIYLDQNKWIDLARADHGRRLGEPFVEVLALARQAVQDGRVRFPLSLAHYMETMNEQNKGKRERLAATMLSLSRTPDLIGPCTIMGPQEIIEMELEASFARRRGLDSPIAPPLFGDGFGHILADPSYGRVSFQIPDNLPPGPKAVAEILKRQANAECEAMFLTGKIAGEEVIDVVPDPYAEVAKRHLNQQQSLRDWFDQTQATPAIRRKELAKTVIHNMREIIDIVLARTNTPHSVIDLTSNADTLKLIEDMPSRHVMFELLALSFEDPSLSRDPGDMNDLEAMSMGMVYCDIVVGEKKWGHFVRRSKMAQVYGCTLYQSINDLVTVLR